MSKLKGKPQLDEIFLVRKTARRTTWTNKFLKPQLRIWGRDRIFGFLGVGGTVCFVWKGVGCLGGGVWLGGAWGPGLFRAGGVCYPLLLS